MSHLIFPEAMLLKLAYLLDVIYPEYMAIN